jgi:hypothetical protein
MQAALADQSRRYTVAEYMKLDVPGRTELIGGVISVVSPKNTPHGFAIRHLNAVLTPAIGKIGDRYAISIQDPIAVAGWHGPHAPEIDVAVVDRKRYTQTPSADDSLAFVEVSDSTYADDKRVKIPLFVAANVPTWHVNIPDRQVEYYERDADLAAPRIFRVQDTFDILGVPFCVRDLFEAESTE